MRDFNSLSCLYSHTHTLSLTNTHHISNYTLTRKYISALTNLAKNNITITSWDKSGRIILNKTGYHNEIMYLLSDDNNITPTSLNINKNRYL